MAKTAKCIRVGSTYHGGLEGKLSLVGILLFVLSVLLATVFFLMTPYEGWLVALMTLFNGLIAWLLFQALAEHLRLQKKIAGLPYGGRISRNFESPVYRCGECDRETDSPYYCYYCRCDLVDGDPSDAEPE
ncbi:hypothetical protein [Aeoliella mucimassa]|uniref:Uncharacterized protein n=1 Tax=Aeoliella mucimassa TaxID=2527972 RepID=A0A518ATV0_9BACT|nr:hypothetical protein [Aeoliella mucimassa]QDU58148.1 hypothetical protein Pan181_43750 [Aeoliella mucimassa]